MKNFRHSFIAMTLMAMLAGCASIGDEVINCEMGIRNHILAQKAWGHWSWCYDKLEYPWSFAKGFKAGYRNILDGGSGCQPTLPPKCYWKPDFQTPEGHCMIHAWFDGFSHGALAAKQDGYGALGELPISPTARANIERNRTPRPEADHFHNTTLPDLNGILLPTPANENEAGSLPAVTNPLEGGPALPLPEATGRPYEE